MANSKRNIGIIGFGSLGRQILNLITQTSEINELHVFDRQRADNADLKQHPFDDYLSEEFQDLTFFVGLAYYRLRERQVVIENLKQNQRKVPALIHPSCHVDPTATVGHGSILFPMCNIDWRCSIGDGVVLHNSTTVSHDSKIQASAFFSAGVVLCGRVTVGERTFIGAGAAISNEVNIGSDAIIGIGSSVSRDVENNQSVIGNPARLLQRPIRLR